MKNSDFKVIFSEDFNLKISELVFFINYKFCNPTASSRIKNKLIKSAESLSSFPERHPVICVENFSGFKVRKFVVDKYIITYLVDTKNRSVHIVNLLFNNR